MSSFDQTQTTLQQTQNQLSPRANVFLLVNLGCEMLYVIDQRLKAQQIAEDKSIQVIHDITAVLFEPKFIDSIIIGSTHSNAQLLTAEHCKFMLKDIATCSLMRLDDTSMDKLWNLMTMIYKWQLYISKHQHHLLDITFRHLNAIGKLHAEAKRNMLIDFTKNTLLDFWNASSEEEQTAMYRTNIAWLECFNIKISVLIRLGFQTLDGSFVSDVQTSYFQDFADSIGDNIYEKSVEIVTKQRLSLDGNKDDHSMAKHTACGIQQLADLLNFQTNDSDDLKPIDASQFQQQYERHLQQCNILFEDLDVSGAGSSGVGDSGGVAGFQAIPAVKKRSAHGAFLDLQLFPESSTRNNVAGEFVHMTTVYNRNPETSETTNNVSGVVTGGGSGLGLNKDLLELYSKMN